MSDPRFARLRSDPRFRRPKKHESKVVVDDRFKSIFEDGKKKSQGSRVDKYGRKVSDTHIKDNLRRFYRLEEAQDESPKAPDYARGEALLESSEEEQQDSDSDDGEEVVLGGQASKPIRIPADEEHLEVNLNEDDDAYTDLDAQAATYSAAHKNHAATEDFDSTKTNRLAVVNLDWDHVRASHLYKIFSSLVSPTAALPSTSSDLVHPSRQKNVKVKGNKSGVARGKVLSVRVYPSEFGKERLKREEVEGPPKEVFKKSRRNEIDGEEEVNEKTIYQEDDGDEYDEDALRKYQLERLRYYYAIITCDTVDASAHIYTELDGTELERSANVFDLSFVPNDMTFDDNEFRDEATPATEVTGGLYKGLDFSTGALRHSKVKLTWDDDDPERNKLTRRALSRQEIEEGNFKAFIASSESESSGDEQVAAAIAVPKSKPKSGKAERERLRALLLGGDDGDLPEGWGGGSFGNGKEGEGESEMEITFMPGLSESKGNEDSRDETTLEIYQRKQKEKRALRKKEKGELAKEMQEEPKNRKETKDDFFDIGESDGDDKQPRVHESKDKKHKKHKIPPAASLTATEAELALLAVSNNPAAEPKHFDMKSILKSEKSKGRKKGKKDKKHGGYEEDADIQENFNIDVKDERFKAVHEDHVFAIDPSNPQFKKTKSMAALLEERAKRQKDREAGTNERTLDKKSPGDGGTRNLQSLVESVKRKSVAADGQGFGKRRRV